ncbi:RIMS binding protein [Lycorma delicatula]|uniref:RIMS binding protein n=1 Tax=Lycorma delicatula TaxID=130591 RepID=UPI003F512D47
MQKMIPESCKWIKGNGEILKSGTGRDKVESKKRCFISNSELEDQLVRVLEKNTELTIQNTDLQKQVQQLQNVKGESGLLQADKLESILKQMRETADFRKELEKEHTEAVNQLKEKQFEVQRKLGSANDKSKAYENIETLQSKIRELEKKTELQNVRHEELMLEMAAIKRSQNKQVTTGTTINSWKKSGLHQEIQTSPGDSAPPTPDGNSVDQGTPMSVNTAEGYMDHQRTSPGVRHRLHNTADQIEVIVNRKAERLSDNQQQTPEALSNIVMQEIDRMANSTARRRNVYWWTAEIDKLRQELRSLRRKKQRLLRDGTEEYQYAAKTYTEARRALNKVIKKKKRECWGNLCKELDTDPWAGGGLAARLTDAPTSSYMVSAAPAVGLPMIPTLQARQMPLIPQVGPPASLPTYQLTSKDLQPQVINPLTGQYQFVINSGGAATQPILPSINQSMVVPQHHGRLMPQIPTIVTSQFELDNRNNFLNGNPPTGIYSTFPEQQLPAGSDKVDMLDIPGKGRCYVYIARYSYDPYQQSPNECPEAELAVNAGDYLLVWGNMDEDGFYDGELLDGRRGLVPSNFIQKLVGDDLLEFHQAVVQGLRDCDDSASTNIPQDLDYHHANATDEFVKHTIQDFETGDFLDDEEEVVQNGEGPVPAPKQLTLERQLNKSILIGWNPPDSSSSPPIDCYHVYVDGVLKVTVKATERTRALVEGVDSTRPHRISVRSVTVNRRTSRDAACTMVIGKDVPLGPSQVKATRVTATSAVISWLPSNSNFQHTVCVNNVELRTVKPGVYRHTITGLAPNTVYRVTVRAKNIRAPHFDEKSSIPVERYSCHIDFRTLPKGLPEPPVDIQVEPGPQDGTLLVTWQPASNSGNPALVTGYAVYADGKKVTDVDSPTGDHALIDINKLLSLNPKQVTVRTKSRDNQSSDSLPTPIPSSVLKGKHLSNKDEERRLRYGSSAPSSQIRHNRSGQVIIETDENLSDKEIYPSSNHTSIPAIEITKDTGSEGNFSEEDYVERGDAHRGMRSHHGSSYETSLPQHRTSRHHSPRHHPPPSHHSSHSRSVQRRDERDQYSMSDRGDIRGRHMDKGGYSRGLRGGTSSLPQPQGGVMREKRPRWFVALFDYDPTTMSPNPDACDEELPFSEGDTIKVFGEKDADGFYWGECRGRRGFVPHNMVVEVQQGVEGGGPVGRSRDRWGDIYANMPVKKMIAMYDYDPQELSPNVDAEVELSFNTGNIIYVYGEMDDDGFYMGELDGVRGLVPSNFLTEAPPDYNNGAGPPIRGPPPSRAPGRGVPGDRGYGPGARGPPLPPRDAVQPRMDARGDRRKDACPPPTQLDQRQVGRRDTTYRMPQTEKEREQEHERELWDQREQERDKEREQREPEREGHMRMPSTLTKKYAVPPAPQPAQPPTVAATATVTADTKPQAQTSEQPGANLMQKLSEMTGVTGVTGGDNSVDHILSKGKELIFMKFGLGK